MTDDTTRVSELREVARRFVTERQWERFHSPKNLAMALAAEAAELLEHFLWIEDDESRQRMQDPAQRDAVADELADVLGVCLSLSNTLNLDLSAAFARKMAKNALKYPVDLVRGRSRISD